MKKALFTIRVFLFSNLKLLFSWWRKPLNKTATIQLLEKNIIYEQKHPLISAASYISLIGDKSKLRLNVLSHHRNLENNTIDFEPDYVWQISRDRQFSDLQICTSGSPLINKKLILNLDYGTLGALKEFPIKLKTIDYNLVVAPWSHYFGSYYEYILLIVAKLCRIEALLGCEIWQKAKICYPLFKTQYENEYLQKLGISQDSIIDTRQKGLKIQPKTLIIANSQSEINRISPYDINLLRKRFLKSQNSNKVEKRIFLSRRHRRVLKNEAELRDILEQYNFEIIEDTYHTVDEQISLFNSASVIVSIHGAALSNLVWCNPKTKIIELFYSGYNMPCYYYLSKILDLEYNCLFDRSEIQDHFSNKYCDLEIDPLLFDNLLDKVLR